MAKILVSLIFIIVMFFMKGYTPQTTIQKTAISVVSSLLAETMKIWGWYRFPLEQMGTLGEDGKIHQKITNEDGTREIEFSPVSHVREAGIHSDNDVVSYNNLLSDLEASCREKLFSANNQHVKNDVQIHYFMSGCLKDNGLSTNELAYRDLYKYFNKNR